MAALVACLPFQIVQIPDAPRAPSRSLVSPTTKTSYECESQKVQLMANMRTSTQWPPASTTPQSGVQLVVSMSETPQLKEYTCRLWHGPEGFGNAQIFIHTP